MTSPNHLHSKPDPSGEGIGRDPAEHYSLVLKWSDEDQTFVGRVPELPGCCFHGDTRAEAIGEAASAIAAWIEAAEAAGNPVPPPVLLSDADLAKWRPTPPDATRRVQEAAR